MGTYESDAPTPTAELPTQTRRLGKYELIAEIGMGGMAAVYLARLVGPMNFEKVVVVKTIHRHLAREEEFIHMLLDEARISALIKHPNVVDIYDLGVANGVYFIAMEYLAGQPLSQLLKQGKRGRVLDPFTAATIIQQAAGGLHAAHSLTTMSGDHLELIHRDVSPGNIMVLYDGSVKLLDFGVSKARGRITASDTGQLKGKIGYVAPEQVAGNVEIDARVDVYSLGVVMWEMLTYRRLFYNDSQAATLKQIADGAVPPPTKFRSDVPRALEDICLKAVSVRPEDRFQTADDMRRALVDALRTADFDVHAMPAYMKETFAAQRAARARLLREVAGADAAAVEVELQEVDVDPPEYVPEGTPVSGRAAATAHLRDFQGASALPLVAEPTRQHEAIGHGAIGHEAIGHGDGDEEDSETDIDTATEGDPYTAPRSQTAINVHAVPNNARIGLWLGAGVALGALVVFLVLGTRGGGNDEAPGPSPADVAAAGVAGSAEPAQAGAAGEAPGRSGDGADRGATEAAVADTADDAAGTDSGGLGDDAADPGGAAVIGEGDEPDEGGDDPDDADDGGRPGDPDARRRGEPRRRKGGRAEAERLYKEGLKLYIGGDAARARGKFRRALDSDRDYPPAMRGLGLVYERLGRREKAVQWLRKYLRAAPKAKDAGTIRARIKKLGG